MRDLSSATARARWLAEVAAALDQAMILVERLGGTMHGRAEWSELLDMIEAARRRARALRLRACLPIETEPHPNRSGLPVATDNGGSRLD